MATASPAPLTERWAGLVSHSLVLLVFPDRIGVLER